MSEGHKDWATRFRPDGPLYSMLRSPLRLHLLDLLIKSPKERLDAARLSYKSGILLKDVLAAISPLVEQGILDEQREAKGTRYRLNTDQDDALRDALRGFLHEHRHLISRYLFVREEVFGGLIGADERMKVIHQLIHLSARLGTAMLIGGDAGTGKRQAARAVHTLSGHEIKTMLEMDAIEAVTMDLQDPGLHRYSTVLLCHLEAVTNPADQERLTKKLRGVSADGPRLIATTRTDLYPSAYKEPTRAALYGVFNVFPLRLPGLCERPTDLPLLLADVLQQECQSLYNDPFAKSLHDEARSVLVCYSWPGNIAQLRRVLHHAAAQSPESLIDAKGVRALLREESQPGPVDQQDPLFFTLDELEADHLRRLLPSLSYNISLAARRLGITRATLYSKLRRYGIALPSSAKGRNRA